MHHAVALERVVTTDRGVQGILGVAIHAVQILWQFTLDAQVVCRPLVRLRLPRPGPIGVIIILGQVHNIRPTISTSTGDRLLQRQTDPKVTDEVPDAGPGRWDDSAESRQPGGAHDERHGGGSGTADV